MCYVELFSVNAVRCSRPGRTNASPSNSGSELDTQSDVKHTSTYLSLANTSDQSSSH